jgi:hypothetical protein
MPLAVSTFHGHIKITTRLNHPTASKSAHVSEVLSKKAHLSDSVPNLNSRSSPPESGILVESGSPRKGCEGVAKCDRAQVSDIETK